MNEEILRQVQAVREGRGFSARNDSGFLSARGADKFNWLQGMVSNDVRLLEKHKTWCLQACLLTATGHLVSDLTLNLMRRDEEEYLLIDLPRSNTEKVLALLDRYLIMEDVELENVSDKTRCVTLYGASGHPRDVTGYEAHITGEEGWNHYQDEEQTARDIQYLIQTGQPEIGLEAQEILRVEAGIPKYGVDMDESVIALEAGLGPTHISLTKGCYVGQEIIARIDSRGHTNRALTGFIVEAGEIPRHGDKVYGVGEDGAERETGRVTSVIAESPAINGRPIAMGYARHEHRTPDTILTARGEGGDSRLRVVEMPFYRRPSA